MILWAFFFFYVLTSNIGGLWDIISEISRETIFLMVTIPKYSTSVFIFLCWPSLSFYADPCSSGALEKVWNLVSNELTLLLWHVYNQGPLQLLSSNLSLELIEATPSAPLRKPYLFKYHQETTKICSPSVKVSSTMEAKGRGLRGGGGGCALPLRQSKGRECNEKVLGIERVLITAAS